MAGISIPPPKTQVPAGAAIFFPNISTLISKYFPIFHKWNKNFSNSLRNMKKPFFYCLKICNSAPIIFIIVFWIRFYKYIWSEQSCKTDSRFFSFFVPVTDRCPQIIFPLSPTHAQINSPANSPPKMAYEPR